MALQPMVLGPRKRSRAPKSLPAPLPSQTGEINRLGIDERIQERDTQCPYVSLTQRLFNIKMSSFHSIFSCYYLYMITSNNVNVQELYIGTLIMSKLHEDLYRPATVYICACSEVFMYIVQHMSAFTGG